MFAKLEGLEKKYMELEQALAQPDVYNDQDQYRKLTKAHADLRDVVELFRRHRSLTQELEENKQLLHDSDPDIKAMAQEEIAAAEAELPELEHKIRCCCCPRTRWTKRTPSLKSAPVPAVKKRPLGRPPTFSACTPAMPRSRAGRWRS